MKWVTSSASQTGAGIPEPSSSGGAGDGGLHSKLNTTVPLSSDLEKTLEKGGGVWGEGSYLVFHSCYFLPLGQRERQCFAFTLSVTLHRPQFRTILGKLTKSSASPCPRWFWRPWIVSSHLQNRPTELAELPEQAFQNLRHRTKCSKCAAQASPHRQPGDGTDAPE